MSADNDNGVDRPACRDCLYFLAPSPIAEPAESQAAARAAGWRGLGTCHRHPAKIGKDPGDWCGEHPAFAMLRNERIAQAIAGEIEIAAAGGLEEVAGHGQ